MATATSVALLFLQLVCAVSALHIAEHHVQGKARGPLKIRQGTASDTFMSSSERENDQRSKDAPTGELPFNNLDEVLVTIRKSLPGGFGPKSSIVNVGASIINFDPIYTHPDGYHFVSYECDSNRELCLTGATIVPDMHERKVEPRFSLIKTDIDSVDGPMLDAVLRNFKPYVVYSEIMGDFAPPVEFTLVNVDGPRFDGCFGMSLSMAHHILQRHGYRLIEASHANIIAVHEDVAHLFGDRPQDPWFWFQFTESSFYQSHGMGGEKDQNTTDTPLSLYGKGLGLYTEVERTDGHDNFGKPPVGIRSMDMTMSRIAQRVESGCKLSKQNKYMLAVGDRCCAPQWAVSDSCVCEFPE